MTDELDILRKELKADNALPRESQRKAAIFAAMDAFDKENSTAAQGKGIGTRLMDQGRAFFTRITKERSMKLTHVLAGGASLAVLTLAILNTQELSERYFGPKATDEVASRVDTGNVQAIKKELKVTEAEARRQSQTAKLQAEKQFADTAAEPAQAQPQPSVAAKPSFDTRSAKVRRKAVGGGRLMSMTQGTGASIVAGHAPVPPAADVVRPVYEEQGRDKFTKIENNSVKLVTEDPVSTFSIDVDTASYAFMRSQLTVNRLPQKDAVRVEELINYFPYDYAPPADKTEPFATHVSVMPSPWNTNTKLVHIGLKGYELPKADRPRSNLVFLLDTSGSMNQPNKLPLLVNSFKLLLSSLQADDTISIVTYAGSAGTVLEPTKVKDKNKILNALNRLHAGGSTAGAEGIRQAYQLAEQNFEKEGVNRVILATDGDFNVGIRNPDELKGFVERKRKTGITLSVLGFGRGNYNDALMQTLAQNGNGNAAYIDTLNEARKVLVEEAGSTLFTIAKDVKIQVEFNPQTVSEYRLIGYETRILKREDFNNDKVDAGDIGAGHSVTAIYEITPKDAEGKLVDDLRYAMPEAKPSSGTPGNEYAFLKLRYKLPDSDKSILMTKPITLELEKSSIQDVPRDVIFATAVAGFGQILRGGRYTGAFGFDDVIKLANAAKGDDEFGYRAEFVNLVRLAKSAEALQPLKQ